MFYLRTKLLSIHQQTTRHFFCRTVDTPFYRLIYKKTYGIIIIPFNLLFIKYNQLDKLPTIRLPLRKQLLKQNNKKTKITSTVIYLQLLILGIKFY